EGSRQQKTPEKRGQKQERQGSGGGGDVHAQMRRRRQAARAAQPQVVRHVRRPQGGGVVGAGRGDQARLRAEDDQDGANRARWGEGAAAQYGTTISQRH